MRQHEEIFSDLGVEDLPAPPRLAERPAATQKQG
jgi:hypothetical protein